MKQFFLLALAAISISVSAQKLQTDKVDEFTGSHRRVTELELIGKSPMGAHASAFNIDGTFGIYIFTLADIGCAGTKDGQITFLFTDISIFVLDPEAFTGKTVSKFRFTRSDGYADYTWAGKYTMEQLFNAVK
jgi:hypothetical protein